MNLEDVLAVVCIVETLALFILVVTVHHQAKELQAMSARSDRLDASLAALAAAVAAATSTLKEAQDDAAAVDRAVVAVDVATTALGGTPPA